VILVIDNYDSFVYNLVQYLGSMGADLEIRRNDAITLDEIDEMKPDIELVLISPGPSTPLNAGISLPLLARYASELPIFGVCLGHQAIAHAFGATVGHARRPMHGKRSTIFHDGKGVFQDLPPAFPVVRYHSLAVDPLTLPDFLEVTAVADDGEVMGLRHRELPIEGVQFHPESIFTEYGRHMVANALSALRKRSEVRV
jgi:anthranilate synthase/aminodeoxychorismate synthase-like glutamine amidotransferase